MNRAKKRASHPLRGDKFAEGGKGFWADVVLDALSIASRHLFGNAERFQEIEDDFVTATGFLRKPAPGIGKKNRAIGLRGDEAVALKALDGAAYGDVGDAETARQVNDPRLACAGSEFGDQFHVVFGGFVRVLFPGAGGIAIEGGGALGRGLSGAGGRSWHCVEKNARNSF